MNVDKPLILIIAMLFQNASSTAVSAEKVSTNDRTQLGALLTVFTPDRTLSAVLIPNGVIHVHSSEGALVGKFHHCFPVAAVFSSSNTFLCSAGQPRPGVTTFKIWRLSDRKLLSRFETDTEDVPVMTFSAKGDLLASTVGRTQVALWELPQAQRKWTASMERHITSLSFVNDDVVLAKCADSSHRRFTTATGKKIGDASPSGSAPTKP